MQTPLTVENPRNRKGSGNGVRGRKMTDAKKLMQHSFTSKNKTVGFSFLCETNHNLSRNLRDLKSGRRKLFNDLANYCRGNSIAKAYYPLYRAHRKVIATEQKKNYENTESDDSILDFDYSQVLTLEEIFDI